MKMDFKESLENFRKHVLLAYAAIVHNVPSQIYLDFLNARTAEDFFKFFRTFGGGETELYLTIGDDMTPETLQDFRKAMGSPDAFLKHPLGAKLVNSQARLREDIEKGRIYNFKWQDANIPDSKISFFAGSPELIVKLDILSKLSLRLVVDVMGGFRVGKCAADDCGKFFKAYRSGKTQKYCSPTCRKRAFRKRKDV